MPARLVSRLITPGSLSARAVAIGSLLAMTAILAFDMLVESDIRLRILYVFPLALISLHCPDKHTPILVLVLSVIGETVALVSYKQSLVATISDSLIGACSFVLVVIIARVSRSNYLKTLQLATFDALTGLYNRHSFETITDGEIARQQRYGGVFSLAFVDLDHFKALNDTQGHHAGDRALKMVAATLQEYTRQSDSVGRLGGDEFAVLMPHTSAEDCACHCQRLVESIARQMSEAGFRVTASIGHHTFTEPPVSTSQALQQADRIMYAAKAAGKGQALGG